MSSAVGRFLDRSIGVAEGLARAAVWVGGALLLAAALLIGVEVVLRKAFTVSTRGADELSAYVLAIGSSWAFGFALVKKAHIRVDALVARLPLPVRAVLDALALLSLAALGFFLSSRAYALVARSFARGATANTSLQTPLWIPQGLWLAGLVLFTLLALLLLVRVLWAGLVERDMMVIERLAGAPSVEDEIEMAEVRAQMERV